MKTIVTTPDPSEFFGADTDTVQGSAPRSTTQSSRGAGAEAHKLPDFGERYRVLRKLGEGGMGAVYEVDDLRRGTRCALKVMTGAGSEAMMRFKREFRTIADLRHPNLVKLYELHTEGAQWFYTMELIQGADILEVLTGNHDTHAGARQTLRQKASTLLELQKTMRIDAADVMADEVARRGASVSLRASPASDLMSLQFVLAQLLDALEFLHAHGIVHRDLKPDNILVDDAGRISVMDFGIVKDLDDIQQTGREGQFLGTVAYMSPEQARGRGVGPPADLYSLGCILYELLTGELPFQGGLFKVMMAHQDAMPPSPAELAMGIPETLVEVCLGLMAKEPVARLDIGSVRRALALKKLTASFVRPHQHDKAGEVFVGRHGEMSRLTATLKKAVQGQLHVVVLHAESGGGKTALADAFLERARDVEGLQVLRGRCYEREALPFRAFDQVMDHAALLLGQWPRRDLEPILQDLHVAGCVFPVLRYALDVQSGARRGARSPRRSPHNDAAMPEALAHLSQEEGRKVVFEHLGRIFDAIQRRAPLLIVVDDLQWADAESMELLEALLKHNRAGRIMILGLSRPEGVLSEHSLRQTIIRHPEIVEMMAIDPLSAAEVKELLALFLERDDLDVLNNVSEQVGGNPLFVAQLALMLARHAISRLTADALPDLRQLVTQRLAVLEPRHRHVLEVAATAGGVIEFSLLAELSGLNAEDFSATLDVLVHDKLLRPVQEAEQGDEGLSYDLYHDKYRELAYETLTERRRHELHRTMAEALEARDGNSEALLRHWSGCGEYDKARFYGLRAAEEAAEKLAFGRAASLFEQSLEGWTPADDGELKTMIDAWERAGHLKDACADLAGALYAWAQATEMLIGWRADDKRVADERRLTLHRLRRLQAGVLFRSRQLDKSQALYLQLLQPRGLKLRRSLNASLLTLGWLQTLLALWSLIPRDLFRKAATPWQRETMALHHDITDSVGWTWLSVGLENNLRSSLLARRLSDPRDQLHAQVTRAVVVGFSGNAFPAVLARSHRMLDVADQTAQAHQIPLGLEFSNRWRAALSILHDPRRAYEAGTRSVEGYIRRGAVGRSDVIWALGWKLLACETLALRDEAMDICQSMETYNTAWGWSFSFAPRLRVQSRHADFEAGDDAIARWRAMLPETVTAEHFWFSLSAGMLNVARGRYQEVLEDMDRIYPKAREIGLMLLNFNKSHWMTPYMDAAVGLQRAGKLAPSRRKRVMRAARQIERAGIVSHRCMGARANGLLAHYSGDAQGASRHIRRALHLSKDAQAPYHRWRCLEAARLVGVADDAQQAEAEALAGEHTFIDVMGEG